MNTKRPTRIQTNIFDDTSFELRQMNRLERQKNWEQLAEKAKNFTFKHKEIAEGHYYSGIANANLGKRRKAISDFNKAITEDKDYRDAYMQRALTRAKMGHNKLAQKDLKLALEKERKIIETRDRKKLNETIKRASQRAKDFEKEFLITFENQTAKITSPTKITERFHLLLNDSYVRLYGRHLPKLTDESDSEDFLPTDRLKHNSYAIDQLSDRNSLAYKADNASSKLRSWIMIIWLFVTGLFFFDLSFLKIPLLSTVVESENNLTVLFRYGVTLLFLTLPFVAFAKRAERQFENELTRFHAIFRDLNMLLIWNALSPEKRSEFPEAIYNHLSENSSANISLEMFNPSLATKKSEAKVRKLLNENMNSKLKNLIKINNPPDTTS